MDNKQVTAEWIAQQREICDVRIAKMLGKFEHNAYDYNIDGRVLGVNISEFKGYMLLAGLCSEVLPAALDALEASMAREAEKDATITHLKTELSTQKVAYQKLYGNHQKGISPNVIACPACGGVDSISLHQRMDAPELFGLSCGECGSHATIQLFADPDEIARLTVERDAAIKDAALSKCKTCASRENCYVDADCDICIDWQWRGLCASNTDAPTGAESE